MIAEKIEAQKEEQTEVFEALFRQIEEWVREENERIEKEARGKAKQQKWAVFRAPHDDRLLPSIEKQTIMLPNEDSVTIEAAGTQYDGKFVADMRGWPTFVRIRLLSVPGSASWKMETDAGVPFHHEWNRANFTRMVRNMTAMR